MMESSLNKKSLPLVLFSITNGWGIRNFCHTGIFETLARSVSIGVVTSKELVPFFDDLVRQGKIAYVCELTISENLFWRLIRRAKKLILQCRLHVNTGYFNSLIRARNPVDRALRAFSWTLMPWLTAHWQFRMLEWLELVFFSKPDVRLPEMPILFINCAPFDMRDNHIQRWLYKQKIPTVSIIPSWDNPSSKGSIFSLASKVLVWSAHQRCEILGFYPNIPHQAIAISGIPQFEAYYHDLPEKYQRDAFLPSLGIPVNRKIILYGTVSSSLFPTEPEIVGHIAAALEKELLDHDAHLLIRCHPIDYVHRYQHLCSSRVTVFASSVGKDQNLYTWIPPVHELLTLAAMVRSCHVCINTGSTMTLDAIVCGKPVINIAYDGDQEKPYLGSMRRYYDYHHFAPITLSKATTLVKSEGELIEALKMAFLEPDRLKHQRQKVVETFCHRPANGSIDFIVREIETFVDELSPTA